MSETGTKTLFCPFCGAPQKDIVPPDTVQIKCKYCGGIILVPSWMGGETHRCPNHPERLADGRCNDCGKSFCEDCLNSYELKARGESAVLYLCPECLQARYDKRTNGQIMGGAAMILVGIVELFVIAPAGILFIVLGLGLISYATLTRKTALEATVSTSPSSGEVEIGAEAESGENYDFEEDYDRLLNFYVGRWGAALGMDLLDKEIAAYTRHGESFAFAIKKISRSREKDLNKT